MLWNKTKNGVVSPPFPHMCFNLFPITTLLDQYEFPPTFPKIIQLLLQPSLGWWLNLCQESFWNSDDTFDKTFWASPPIGIRVTRRQRFHRDLNRNGVIRLPQQQEVHSKNSLELQQVGLDPTTRKARLIPLRCVPTNGFVITLVSIMILCHKESRSFRTGRVSISVAV
jgi:hypothetical protein